MQNIFHFSLNDFLLSSKRSSQHAYENIKNLLNAIENTNTHTKAITALLELKDHLISTPGDHLEDYFFSIDKFTLSSETDDTNVLFLLQLPSIFTPEEWSFTFYEGLLRIPQEEFVNRVIVELGCGNGWISLALAKKFNLTKIIGLDLNPKAVVCAKLNLYLNSYKNKAEPIFDSSGKMLHEKVYFETSDLLSHCIQNNISVDKIIGCIPQVLDPNHEFIPQIIPENSSDEALYALSNYCGKQGLIEDQFGLGLIARALEESVTCLKAGGHIILNLGGRPGESVLERMFTRRGFKIKKIWETRIEQAEDTDILPLVAIETKSLHKFQFFLSEHSEDSVGSKTAYVHSKNGGKIYHSLIVIKATLIENFKTKKILNLLKNNSYKKAKDGLDLAFENEYLTREKVSYLAYLSEQLLKTHNFPYKNVAGDKIFRRNIAEYLRAYWNIPLSAKNILIAPHLNHFIQNTIQLLECKKILLDSKLLKDFPTSWFSGDVNFYDDLPVAIECLENSEITAKIIKTFRPCLVVYRATENGPSNNLDSLRRIIQTTAENKSNLIIDITDIWDFSSTPKNHAIFSFLNENKLPNHASIICNLEYNEVYPDLNLSFLISENQKILDSLSLIAEVTYSRTCTLIQDYYNNILIDLLSFKLKSKNTLSHLNIRMPDLSSFTIPISIQKTLDLQIFKMGALTLKTQSIRMDYGENCLESPGLVKSLLMESFVRNNLNDSDFACEQEIKKYLENKFHLKNLSENNIFISNGTAQIFSSICKSLFINNKYIIFPKGCYGYFYAAASFHKVKTLIIETNEKTNFKIGKIELLKLIKTHALKENAYIFLNYPLVNPTGQIYTNEELSNIFEICKEHKINVIIDTIFSGLEYSNENYLINSGTEQITLFGGISKEYSCGGIRFGFCYTTDPIFKENMNLNTFNYVANNIKFFAKNLYTIINQFDPELETFRTKQTRLLKQRHDTLASTLSLNGWLPMESYGGLFLIAKPSEKLINKSVTITGQQIIISYKNIHEILYDCTGLLINGTEWTGLNEYCRFVLSLLEKDFEEALEQIKSFYILVSKK